jgi:4-carboxymuconolactone decarboxylase
MSRLPAVNPELLDAEQRAVYDAIANGPRKGVPGPLAVWLHRPKLADLAQALGQYCRYDSSLAPRLSELAILLMGRHWLAEYEWATHKPFALEAGLSLKVIDAIRDGRTPDFVHRDEEMVYAFITQLHANRGIDDALYAQVAETLGQDGIVDLVGVAGYYTLISMTIKAFDVPLSAGAVPELPTSLE